MRTWQVPRLTRNGGWIAIRHGCCTRSRSCSRRTATRRTSALKRVRFSLKLAAAHRLGGRSPSAFSSYLATRGTRGVCMKMRVQLVIEDASGASTCTDIAAIERHTDDLIGLSLEEAKAMTGAVQRKMVEARAREVIDRGSICPACQQRLRRNGKASPAN